MTPAEARAAVEEHGGVRPAARVLGMPHETLRNQMDPERYAERQRLRYHAASPEKRADRRAQMRENYHSRSALQHARHALQKRRSKALKRMEARTKGALSG